MAFDPTPAAETVYLKMQQDGVPQPPPPQAAITTLTDFASEQYAQGQQIGVADPAAYAYAALGATLTGLQYFSTYVAPGTDSQFMSGAYQTEFGAGTIEQLQAFGSELSYLENLYAQASVPNGNLIARGAVYGTMIGIEAELRPASIVGVAQHAQV